MRRTAGTTVDIHPARREREKTRFDDCPPSKSEREVDVDVVDGEDTKDETEDLADGNVVAAECVERDAREIAARAKVAVGVASVSAPEVDEHNVLDLVRERVF